MRAFSFVLIPLMMILSSCSSIHEMGVEGYKEKESIFKVVWNKSLDPNYNTGNFPIGLQSPYAYEGMVFMGSSLGKMVAYDIETGDEIWSSKDGGGFDSAPFVYNEKLIYGNNAGRFYSRDYITGELNYVVDLKSGIEAQPYVYDGRVLLHLRDHTLVSLDAETGKVLWQYKRAVPLTTTLQVTSRPLVVDNKVIVGFSDGVALALSLDEGIVLWESRISNATKFPDVGLNPVLFEGKVIIGAVTSPIAVLDPDTGIILNKINMAASRTPLIRSGQGAVLGNFSGELVIFNSNFIEVSRTKISDSGISSIVPWKGGLAVSTYGRYVYFVDLSDMSVKGKFDFGSSKSSVLGDMVVNDGYLVIPSSRNRLYVLK